MVGGSLSVEGAFALSAQDTLGTGTTPSVAGGSNFLSQGTALVTTFTGATAGQLIVVELGSALDWDCDADNLKCGSADITGGASGDTFTWLFDGSDFILLSWFDISDSLQGTDGGNFGADLAEYFPSTGGLEPGDVVAAATGFPVLVTKSEGPYQQMLLGVVTTAPALTFGDPTTMENPAAIALAGRVPVKVTNENGPISVGDFLTSSSTPGYAMKATQPGRVVGMALESFNGLKGKVIMLVDNSFWQAPVGAAAALSTTPASGDLVSRTGDGNNEFTNLFATSGKFTLLGAVNGAFGSLVAGSASFDNLEVANGAFALLESTSATFEELQAGNAAFDNLEAGSGSFTNLVVTSGSFQNLEAESATFGSLEATEGLTVGQGGDTATIIRHLSAAAILDFSLPASSCQDLSILVEGASTSGDTVAVGAPSTLGAGVSVTGFVSAPDQVTVRLCNPTTQSLDPSAEDFRVDVWQHR